MQTLAEGIFWFFVLVTFSGAVLAVSARTLIRRVAGLALCFTGVAGLYYYLSSPFVAFMQMLVYVGALCVTITFAIMDGIIRISARARETIVELFGDAALEQENENTWLARIPLTDNDQGHSFVASLGCDAEVLAPECIRESMNLDLDAALAEISLTRVPAGK